MIVIKSSIKKQVNILRAFENNEKESGCSKNKLD